MTVCFRGGEIKGAITPPPSKSHTHRALFLAALADGESTVENLLVSDDTRATLGGVESMGATTSVCGDRVSLKGGRLHAPSAAVDAYNSGTTMRIFSGIASLFDTDVTITGDASLRKRPMGPLLEALSQTGVSCRSEGGFPPITVRGPNKGGRVRIDGSVSSQFISSLMIAAPMIETDTEITVETGRVSAPYIDITASMMRRFGAEVSVGDRIEVRGGTGYSPCRYRIPADFSSAAFPMVAAALGGDVSVRGVDMDDPQGDRAIVGILRGAGAIVEEGDGGIRVRRGDLRGTELDMGRTPDLFPVVAVLLSTAEGDSRLYGAPQLRFKESDRIETTVNMLRALGADASGTEDGCIIHGRNMLKGGRIEHRGDHRIMMAAAVASLVCEGPVTMEDADCCAVSYPGFLREMREIGLESEVT